MFFSRKLSQFLVLSAISIFNDLTLALISDPHHLRTTPTTPWLAEFCAAFGKIWQNRMLASPGGLAPPPADNPGEYSSQLADSKRTSKK